LGESSEAMDESLDANGTVTVAGGDVGPGGYAPVDEWGADVDPTNVVIAMTNLSALNHVLTGTNTKPLPESYKKLKWPNATALQKNKSMEFYKNCTEAGRTAILTQARSVTATAAESVTTKSERTHKDDIARLLCLRKDPQSQMNWSKTLSILNRPQLDRRKSDTPSVASAGSTTMGEEESPWGLLAARFNDFVDFRPQNITIKYAYDEILGRPVPVVPFRSANKETETIFSKCKELNPCNDARKDNIRDGAWVKRNWTEYRGVMNAIFSDFSRSGNQSSKDEAEVEWMSPTEQARWVYHAGAKHRLNDTVTTYAYCIFEKADFEENLGKEMRAGSGVDSSLGGSDKKKKKDDREKVKRTRKARRHGGSTKGDTTDDSALAKVLENAMSGEARRAELQLLLQYGSAEDKANALQQIRSLVAAGSTSNNKKPAAANDQLSDDSSSSDSDISSSENESTNKKKAKEAKKAKKAKKAKDTPDAPPPGECFCGEKLDDSQKCPNCD